MLGIGKRARGGAVAVADIGSGSVGIAIIAGGNSPTLLAMAREDLSLEERSGDALAKGVLQALAAAGEKVLKEYSEGSKHSQIAQCYAIIGAPWTRSIACEADSHLEKEMIITDDMIGALAKQALTDQKTIERKDLLEANVVRVLLNGYPTETPTGKRAQDIHIYTLLSDCDPAMKNGVQEVLARLFPGAPVTWRSSARAAMNAARLRRGTSSLIAVVGTEATDAIVVRKGVLTERALIPQGLRQVLSSFAAGKPVEETLALLDMLEKDQCEDDACKALEASIAKAEPELAHSFGETFAKLSAARKLPDEIILIAPSQISSWFSRFFSRIDFTQFAVSARPFAVSTLTSSDLPGLPQTDPRILADPGLCIGCTLVNIELRS